MNREQETTNKLEAFLEMIREDGVSPPGDLPPVEYLEALNDLQGHRDAPEVARKHRRGEPP